VGADVRERSNLSPIEYLTDMNALIDDRDIRFLNLKVLDDARFQSAPCSAKHHHIYEGGLASHTAEVLSFALDAGKGRTNRTILVTAAIWHDYMKIEDYEMVDGKPKETLYRTRNRHVTGSYAEFLMAAKQLEIPKPFQLDVGHCILAHHGRNEWGSPVEPQTPEAWILHAADMWSAHYGPTVKP